MKMKKLICIKDIQQLIETKQEKCMIPEQTIITPAARDLAEEHHIKFELETFTPSVGTGEFALLIKKLYAEPRLLQELMAVLENQPYVVESEDSGFKLIRGNTIRYDKVNPNSAEEKQVLFDSFNGTKMELVKLSKGTVTTVFTSEEIHFTIEGNLTTTINQKSFDSQKGDVHYYPCNSRVTRDVKENTHLLVIKIEKERRL